MRTEGFDIRSASLADCDELLHLYFAIYGKDYPLEFGTDKTIMTKFITDPESLWLVACDTVTHRIAGCLVVEVDPSNRIGKAQGLAVHPDYRHHGLATQLIDRAGQFLLNSSNPLHSIFATTRTVSIGPQLAFLKERYLPLGIFPNAHRLQDYETLTLMARHSELALTKRHVPSVMPDFLFPLKQIVDDLLELHDPPIASYLPQDPAKRGADLDFELIDAPRYVMGRFLQTFADPYERFYPFNAPNFLMASTNGEVEIYAHKNKDGYCSIVALTKDFAQLAGRLRQLLRQLRFCGVSYIELLVDVEDIKSLEVLHYSFFLPSAYYPALLERDGQLKDHVLMTRTMEPLNFRGMEIEHTFKPFVDLYVNQWKRMHLDVLGVFNEYELQSRRGVKPK